MPQRPVDRFPHLISVGNVTPRQAYPIGIELTSGVAQDVKATSPHMDSRTGLYEGMDDGATDSRPRSCDDGNGSIQVSHRV